jgi:heat shock protein HslJ
VLNGNTQVLYSFSDHRYRIFISGNFFVPKFVYEVTDDLEMKRNSAMKRDHIRFILLYMTTTVFLIACGISGIFSGGGMNHQEELEEIVWTLEAMGAQGNPQPVVESRQVTLIFDFSEGRVNGNGGCNSYSADFEINGKDISIGLAMSTLMACYPEEVMNQETAYHQLLAKAKEYEVGVGRLSIYTSDNQVLVFSHTQ